MNTQMKQRVIGGLVLVAVLAIFLPILFHSSRSKDTLQLSTAIPQAPQVQLQLPNQQMANALPPTLHAENGIKPVAPKVAQPEQPAVAQPVAAEVARAPVKISEKSKPVVIKAAPKRKPKPRVKKHMPKAKRVAHRERLAPPMAWVVQLASFSQPKNAERLIRRLRGKGLTAYTRTTRKPDNTTLTRVYVGPELQRNKAHQVQQRLKQEFKLNGVVRKYTL